MLEWEIGTKKSHEINLGAGGKRLEKHLEAEVWKDIQQTYASASYEETRKSILMIYKLFKQAAQSVVQYYGYDYPEVSGEKALAFFKHASSLPKDAKSIY